MRNHIPGGASLSMINRPQVNQGVGCHPRNLSVSLAQRTPAEAVAARGVIHAQSNVRCNGDTERSIPVELVGGRLAAYMRLQLLFPCNLKCFGLTLTNGGDRSTGMAQPHDPQ